MQPSRSRSSSTSLTDPDVPEQRPSRDPRWSPDGRVFTRALGERFDSAIEPWLESGQVAAEPKVAATVMLLRDGAAGLEVFVQERAATMPFAPAVVVFPGGRVDPADAEAALPEADLRTLADEMALTVDEARPIVAAALREVEEECGVRLSAEGLRPWARWLTPVFEPRRYDTWFFAAAMPDGQVARGTTRETVHEMWGRPVDLVARERAGTLALMPPTIVNLTQLARFEQTADVLTERPSLALVEPKLEQTAGGWVLRSSIP